MKIVLRHVYHRIDDNDCGRIVPPAVVTYNKTPVSYNYVDRGPHPEGQIQSLVTTWRHWVQLDLFLFVLEFSFYTKGHAKSN